VSIRDLCQWREKGGVDDKFTNAGEKKAVHSSSWPGSCKIRQDGEHNVDEGYFGCQLEPNDGVVSSHIELGD
jgi:hypothetical protein